MKPKTGTAFPDSPGAAPGRLPVFASPNGACSLPFEALCASVAATAQTGKPRDLMFTGPALGVGTSTVARNFAETLAAGGEKVLLVQITPGAPAASTPIRSAEDLLPLIRPDSLPTLFTLTIESSRLPAPTAHNGEILSGLVQDWRSRYDSVVWDTPPLDVAPIGNLIARSVSGVILVLHAGHSRWHTARHHAERIRYAGGSLLGVVLNRKKTYIPAWIYRVFFR